MALNTFGWTPAEVTTDSAGNVIAGVTLTVFTDVTKATQVTSLFDKDGTTPLASGVVVSDNKGRFGFKASDAYTRLYVYDGSTADPWPIMAQELGANFATFASLVRNPDALITGTITRDANGAATSAPVTWPDGKPGTYTATTVSATFPGAVDAYTITYGSPVTRTYTQPLVTRDASGAASNVPAITVA